MTIIDNYKRIKDIVYNTALNCGRNPDSVKIIAVSKTFSTVLIQEAINSGIKLFGENKVQEAADKIPKLNGDSEFHMIGHLQSNKSREAVELFELIHSLDKISTAAKLDAEAGKAEKIQRILIQLKTSDESTKHGAGPEEIFPLAEAVSGMKNLRLEGVMSIGPNTEDNSLIKKSFIQTAETLDIINRKLNLDLRELSMGMSGDFTTAVKEGATYIRIGSAIFGERVYNL